MSKKIYKVTQTIYKHLKDGGTITLNGVEYSYEDDALYTIIDYVEPTYTLNNIEDNLRLQRNNETVSEVQVQYSYRSAVADRAETAVYNDDGKSFRGDYVYRSNNDEYNLTQGSPLNWTYSSPYDSAPLIYGFIGDYLGGFDICSGKPIQFVNNDYDYTYLSAFFDENDDFFRINFGEDMYFNLTDGIIYVKGLNIGSEILISNDEGTVSIDSTTISGRYFNCYDYIQVNSDDYSLPNHNFSEDEDIDTQYYAHGIVVENLDTGEDFYLYFPAEKTGTFALIEDLTGYLTKTEATTTYTTKSELNNYLPLSGGTITGDLTVTDGTLSVTKLHAYQGSSSTTIGAGSSGQVLKTDGTKVYWTNDANDTTTIGVGSNYIAKNPYGGYQVFATNRENKLVPMVSGSGYTTATNKTMNTEPFNPFGMYFSSTSSSNRTAGAACSSSTNAISLGFNASYAFNCGSTLTAHKPFYIVAKVQDDGMAVLHTPYYSQDLPTTEDGLIYIYLGQTITSNEVQMNQNHPIYVYKNGQIELYTGASADIDLSDYATKAELNDAIKVTIQESDGFNTEHDVYESTFLTLTGGFYGYEGDYQTLVLHPTSWWDGNLHEYFGQIAFEIPGFDYYYNNIQFGLELYFDGETLPIEWNNDYYVQQVEDTGHYLKLDPHCKYNFCISNLMVNDSVHPRWQGIIHGVPNPPLPTPILSVYSDTIIVEWTDSDTSNKVIGYNFYVNDTLIETTTNQEVNYDFVTGTIYEVRVEAIGSYYFNSSATISYTHQ